MTTEVSTVIAVTPTDMSLDNGNEVVTACDDGGFDVNGGGDDGLVLG